ncbi:MAG TPA: phosphatidylglycerophosphatase A [Candidatus Latescibacteria bacterium]|nr:phosphatidylglycerophosphatase A [Candidatus Latescibacterota bacterium]
MGLVVRRVALILASGGPFGYVPIAPGTAGSLLGLLVYWLLPRIEVLAWVEVIVLGSLVGVWASGRAEEEWGRDAHRIVIDEVVGMWASVAFLPKSLLTAGLGFFIFRFMDIIKPFPVGLSQRLPGGWGVIADDLIAGAYSGLATWGMLRLLGEI